ncbi:hypothetical protein [Ruminiclostridium cellulolyticum]|uniref:Uncharacterized protein n=1 Tax=Ruminiclostridium cellulolyticum (strain ATCC 35319 / DSM 5812 / JCM 6584 / H10) TaxID=394503 RepID=B8I5Q0_RUMCH|nr:hypothetical protein [Ruminiclostridium cellulolyticum]ACL74717.1 hypothetical protein Ccel_0330 [Ruminiclostridium cellulolyticum H10]
MNKCEVMNEIKKTVLRITGIIIEDENDNIIGCHHIYPIVYAIYIVEELEKVFGKEVSDIFTENDYTIWELTNLADAIMNKCRSSVETLQVI